MPKPSASMWRWNPTKAAGIAWGRGGRPTNREIQAKVDREREEARERAQKRIDKQKVISQARYKRERENVERYHAGLQKESIVQARAQEAQAAIFDAQAAEVTRREEEQNWVSEFTPQQRHEISTFETAKGRVRADIGVGLSEIEGVQMIQELDRKIGSYQKVRRPRGPGDPPIYPEGQEIGKTWADPEGSGALLGRNEKGEEVVRVKPGDTLDGIQLKERMTIAAGQRRRLEKWMDEREKFARDLVQDKISIPQKQGWIGEVPDIERYRTPMEVQAELARVFGAAPSWAQVEAPQQRQPIEAEPLEILHAREVIKAPGMGLRNVEAAEQLITKWERGQTGSGITETEYRKLRSGATFIDPFGRERKKP